MLTARTSAAPVLLIDEQFDADLVTNTSSSPHWYDDEASSTSFEQYSFSNPTGSASARGLATTYDHDQSGSTAPIDIPGGLEVNDDTGQVTLTAQFTLPTDIDVTETGSLRFFAAQRNHSTGHDTPTVSLVNLTDARTIHTANVVFVGDRTTWQINTASITWLASDLGDEIALSFYGGGTENNDGLQLVDLTLQSTTLPVPAPAALPAGLLLLLTLCLHRRR